MTMAQPVHCYHCQLPVPKGTNITWDVDGTLRAFCCNGCKSVTQTIITGGLEDYYLKRERAADSAGNERDGSNHALYDSAAFARQHIQNANVENGGDSVDQHEVELLIDGMNCAACVWLIESQLQKSPAVTNAHINYEQRRLRLRWEGPLDGSGKLSLLISAIENLGYKVGVFHPDLQTNQIRAEQRAQLRRLGVAFIGMMQVGMFAVGFYSNNLEGGLEPKWDALLRWISFLVATPVLMYSCQPFFIGALRSIKARALNMDVPVALSLLLAYGTSAIATVRNSGDVYFDAVTMFAFVLLGGRYLETRTRARFIAQGDVRRSLLPDIAWQKLDDDSVHSIALEDIQNGMTIIVKPHDIIPVDGVVTVQAVHVDEAAFTGEAETVHKPVGATVYGGTVNGSLQLQFMASETSHTGRLQQIIDLIAHAHVHKPRAALLADRLARQFVALILLTAAVAYVCWQFIDASRAFAVMLAVLAASCPCALSLATPTALTAATTALRRRGILIMSARALEVMPRVSRFVFDKTGTLTDGQICLGDIRISDEKCLQIAATLEKAVNHPIAAAFADIDLLKTSLVEMIAGKGVMGVVEGSFYRIGNASFVGIDVSHPEIVSDNGHWIYLASDKKLLAAFQLLDHARASAKPTIDALRKTHKISLLSGDGSMHTKQLARELGINDVFGGASPQQKLDQVRAWQQQGECIAMVGDGINDAPVISAANISIAVTNASNIAKAQADCILLSPSLTKLLELDCIARRTQNLIRQNLAWALAYNMLAIPLAFCGIVQPWMAATGMSLSSLLVTLNAQRLLR